MSPDMKAIRSASYEPRRQCKVASGECAGAVHAAGVRRQAQAEAAEQSPVPAALPAGGRGVLSSGGRAAAGVGFSALPRQAVSHPGPSGCALPYSEVTQVMHARLSQRRQLRQWCHGNSTSHGQAVIGNCLSATGKLHEELHECCSHVVMAEGLNPMLPQVREASCPRHGAWHLCCMTCQLHPCQLFLEDLHDCSLSDLIRLQDVLLVVLYATMKTASPMAERLCLCVWAFDRAALHAGCSSHFKSAMPVLAYNQNETSCGL